MLYVSVPFIVSDDGKEGIRNGCRAVEIFSGEQGHGMIR
jgi:hypothetical protein